MARTKQKKTTSTEQQKTTSTEHRRGPYRNHSRPQLLQIMKERKESDTDFAKEATERRKLKNGKVAGDLNMDEMTEFIIEHDAIIRNRLWAVWQALQAVPEAGIEENLAGVDNESDLDVDAARKVLTEVMLCSHDNACYRAIAGELYAARDTINIHQVTRAQEEAFLNHIASKLKNSIDGDGFHNILDAVKSVQKHVENADFSSIEVPSATQSVDHKCRLVHLLVDPHLRQLQMTFSEGKTRAQLDSNVDGERGNLWDGDGSFAFYFNSTDWQPAHVAPDNGTLFDINPSVPPSSTIQGDALKSMLATCRSTFTAAYTKWGASGQNDPDNFWSFANGQTWMLYWYLAIKDDPSTLSFSRKVPDNLIVDCADSADGRPRGTDKRRGTKNKGNKDAQLEGSRMVAEAITASNNISGSAKKAERESREFENEFNKDTAAYFREVKVKEMRALTRDQKKKKKKKEDDDFDSDDQAELDVDSTAYKIMLVKMGDT